MWRAGAPWWRSRGGFPLPCGPCPSETPFQGTSCTENAASARNPGSLVHRAAGCPPTQATGTRLGGKTNSSAADPIPAAPALFHGRESGKTQDPLPLAHFRPCPKNAGVTRGCQNWGPDAFERHPGALEWHPLPPPLPGWPCRFPGLSTQPRNIPDGVFEKKRILSFVCTGLPHVI